MDNDTAGLIERLRGCVTKSGGIDCRDPNLLLAAADALTTHTAVMEQTEKALEFYADPFAWKRKHDPDNIVQIPDFYNETCFGDTACEALSALKGLGVHHDALTAESPAKNLSSTTAHEEMLAVLKECAIRCRYDGDLFDNQQNEVRRDASWRVADLAEAAIARATSSFPSEPTPPPQEGGP